jgi:hypothetical protein
VVTVDLATGKRHRPTTGPDWDEDGAVSPDGVYLVTASWRTMHRIDVLGGMLPEIHSFIDLPFSRRSWGTTSVHTTASSAI